MDGYYEQMRDEAFPDGLRSLRDIRDDRSIRTELVAIRDADTPARVKGLLWLIYLGEQYDLGLITREEHTRLKEWKMNWERDIPWDA